MNTGIAAGNYTPEVWPEVTRCIEQGNTTAWVDLVYGNPPRGISPPYFLVLDIHGFSRFCRKCAGVSRNRVGDMDEVARFLRAFFLDMSQHIHFGGGTCIKFIGDAILAIHGKKRDIIRIGNELVRRYRNGFKGTYPKTDIVVLITHPRECLKGFVAGGAYVDYSYWAPGLNYLFSRVKIVPHGHVYYVRRDGKCIPYDS